MYLLKNYGLITICSMTIASYYIALSKETKIKYHGVNIYNIIYFIC